MDFNPSKPFKPPKRRPGRRPDPTPVTTGEKEAKPQGPFVVLGKSATDIEWYLGEAAKLAVKNGTLTSYRFRETYLAQRRLPGRLEVDFVFVTPASLFPVFVDGDYWHRTPEQKGNDQRKVSEINERLGGTGAYPAQRVPGDLLQSVEDAVEVLKGILRGEFVEQF